MTIAMYLMATFLLVNIVHDYFVARPRQERSLNCLREATDTLKEARHDREEAYRIMQLMLGTQPNGDPQVKP